jgi:two-component system sensor histidine kinase KdpD
VELVTASEKSVEEALLLEEHLELARELGATVARVVGYGVAESIGTFARDKGASLVIAGRSRSVLRRILRGSGAGAFLRSCRGMRVLMAEEGREPPRAARGPAFSPLSARTGLRDIALNAALLGGTIAACLLLRPHLPPLNIGMFFLLFVATSAVLTDRWTGIVFTAAAVLAFDVFFIPPYLSFSVNDLEYLPSFAIMLIVGITLNVLVDVIKRHVRESRERETFMAHLHDFSSTLLTAQTFGDILANATRGVSEFCRCDAVFLLPDHEGALRHVYTGSDVAFDERERAVACWAFDRRQPAGAGTSTLSSDTWHHLPLIVGETCIGVLSVQLHGGTFERGQRRLLQSYLNIICLAMLNARAAPQPDFLPR